nr:hypothetical protein [Tanacetum cinerariifolium]
MFLKYSTSQIPPKKSRSKGSQGKKATDTPVAYVDVSEESEPKPAKKVTVSRRVVRKKVIIFADYNIILDPDIALEIVTEFVHEPTKKKTEQLAADTMQALKESKKHSRRQPGTGGSSERTSIIPGVPHDSTVVSATSSEGTSTKQGVPNKEKVTSEEKVILKWGSEQESEYSEEDHGDDKEVVWIDSNDDDDEEEKKKMILMMIKV